ncbi:MAG: translation initiation factor IF-3, partial [Desulfobacteraceae bacterium]
ISKGKKQDKVNLNRDIDADEVRVIGTDGEQVGIIPIEKAVAMAEERDMDLVEVSPEAKPPVCRIMDYGKYKYERTKKQQEAKKKQKTFQIKEIKVRPKTDDHDLETKVKHVRKFIENNDKVKITLVFRGREITLKDQGQEVLNKVVEMTRDFAQIEQQPKFEGRVMTMLLAPR